MKIIKKIGFTLFLLCLSVTVVHAQNIVFVANIANFCNEEKAQNALRFVGYLLLVVKILVPILLIVFGVVDYFKAVVSSDADAIGKSTKSFIMRVIAGVVIFLIPTIINFVFGLMPSNSSVSNIDKCRACVLSPNKC